MVHGNTTTAFGKWGLCCTEVDIWEANSVATAFTMHPCTIEGTHLCKGKECGDNAKKERYDGVCDKDGCDFNSYRMGVENFFGPGPDYTVDTEKPMTVVTQFVTDDGTDDGDLVEVRRLYVQGGKVIKNSDATILGKDGGDSITDKFCSAQKEAFNDPDDFGKKKALKQTGEALRRGMTLVLSLWDDNQCEMLWLDSDMGKGNHSTPGVARGPCDKTTGVPADVRAKYPDAAVTYYNIMYGEIGSTYTADKDEKPDAVQAVGFPEPTVSAVGAAGGLQHPMQQGGLQSVTVQQPVQQQQQPAQPVAVSAGGVSDVFQQCGGIGWTGPTTCAAGCTCTAMGGPSYSQCVPPQGAYLCAGVVGADQGVASIMKNSLRAAESERAGLTPATASSPTMLAAVPALLLAAAAAALLLRAHPAAAPSQADGEELLPQPAARA